jgi:hypothetical protein
VSARPAVAIGLTLALLAGCVRGRSRDAVPDEPCELGAEVIGGHAEPAAADVVVPVRKKAWEAALGGETAARPYVRARLAGWPARRRVDAQTLPADDRALLEALARDTWRGLAAMTDREHHLPVDHIHLADSDAASRVGDYTNVTTVGLHLIATVGAADLGLLDLAAAEARVAAVLGTLEGLPTYRGYFYNYYDTTSLERTSNLISFVDTSWLTAGLMVTRMAFPALAPRATRLIERTDWRFFYDRRNGRMTHGYWVHRRQRSRYHYGVLYAESRLGSLIAIGTGHVPASHWFRLVRTYPAACAWQREQPQGRVLKDVTGHAVRGGWYVWGGERYVPSWGGSMFEALMPTVVLDERRLAPDSLGANDVAHATVQRRFAAETLGLDVWGMSPSTVPGVIDYGEYGVPVLGVLGYRAGAVTPHAAALALAATPDEAVRALRTLATRYDLYGDFGLYDALDPASGAVARSWLSLDQAMTFIALVNHLRDGAVQRRFAADPIMARVLPLLAAERFFE